MFFVLSKVLIYFIYPLSWIIVLLLIAVITTKKKLKKVCLYASVVLLFLFSNTFILGQFARFWDIRSQNTAAVKYSCAIVLGGFASEDATGKGYFNAASDRFIQAVKLKEQGIVSKILVSSGNSLIKKDSYQEADYVFTQLKAFNIPDSAILIENKSRNTLENALFSNRLTRNAHVKPPFLLITSAFHMRRALYTFRKAGLNVIPYSADFITGNEKIILQDFILPDAGALFKWNFYIKEVVGLAVYAIKTS